MTFNTNSLSAVYVKKYLGRLNTACNSLSVLIGTLKQTRIEDVPKILVYTNQLQKELAEIQRALIYFTNSPPKPPALPPTVGNIPDSG
jgi:hypothetical protein